MSDGDRNTLGNGCAREANLRERAVELQNRLDELYALLGRTKPDPDVLAMMERFDLTPADANLLLRLYGARPHHVHVSELLDVYPSASTKSVVVGVHRLRARLPGAEPIRMTRRVGYRLGKDAAAAVDEMLAKLAAGWRPSTRLINDRRRRSSAAALGPNPKIRSSGAEDVEVRALALMDHFGLTVNEARLALLLYARRGSTVPADELAGVFKVPSRNNLKVALSKLREKFGDRSSVLPAGDQSYRLAEPMAVRIDRVFVDVEAGWTRAPPVVKTRRRRNTPASCRAECAACDALVRNTDLLKARILPLEVQARSLRPPRHTDPAPTNMDAITLLVSEYHLRDVSAKILLRLFRAAPSFVSTYDLLEGLAVSVGSLHAAVHQIRGAVGEEHLLSVRRLGYRISEQLQRTLSALMTHSAGS